MSDTVPALEALYERRRMLELDAVAVKSRIEEISELIVMIEHPKGRRGRPKKEAPVTIFEMPQRVAGSAAIPEPEPPEAA